MSYTVSWRPEAEQLLADIWLNAGDPNAVTDAANALDKALADDPTDLGESRPVGQRVAYSMPLGIRFVVHKAQRHVRVVGVWYVKKRKSRP